MSDAVRKKSDFHNAPITDKEGPEKIGEVSVDITSSGYEDKMYSDITNVSSSNAVAAGDLIVLAFTSSSGTIASNVYFYTCLYFSVS